MAHYITLLMFLLAFAAPCLAEEGRHVCVESIKSERLAGIVDRVEERYASVASLTAKFEQQSYFLGLDKVERSSGSMSYKRPGKMRWEYTQPEQHSFIGDGEKLWFVQPELNQVTLSAFSNSFQSDLPVSFLLGIGELSEAFSAKSACKTKEGYSLTLKPKKDKNLRSLTLYLRGSDFLPLGALTSDLGGNETKIEFQNVDVNGPLKEALFLYEPPRGIDIIDYRNMSERKPLIEDTLPLEGFATRGHDE